MMLLTNQPPIDSSKLSSDAHTIAQQLIALAASYQQRCLVLLDPFLSPINDPIIDYFVSLNQLHQVRIMHPSIRADERPLLLELDLTEPFQQQALSYIVDNALSQLSAKSLSYGIGQQYCAWLLTNAPASQIANDLAKLILQNSGKRAIFLRFYDPAVFSQFMSLLNEIRQKKLYGSIENWVILNSDRTLINHINQCPLTPVLSGQLGLTDALLSKLYCIGINNQMIQAQRLKDAVLSIDAVASLNQIMPCVARMLAKNINDEPLLVEWAALAIKFGEDFDLQPWVQDKIQKLTKSQQYYAIWGELQALSHDNWQARSRGIKDDK